MTGPLNPKLAETGIFFWVIIVAYLGRRIIHPMYSSLIFSPKKTVFEGGLKLRSCGVSENNGISPLS